MGPRRGKCSDGATVLLQAALAFARAGVAGDTVREGPSLLYRAVKTILPSSRAVGTRREKSR